jgi:CheY-like chemotaxis protein
MNPSMRGRILVVDDLPDVRSTVSGILRDAGYLVRSARSRQEALDILENERFHVAVLDVRLDESDEDNQEGLELLDEINQRYPSITVIMLTGYADVEMVLKALQPVNGRQPAYSVVLKNEMMRLPETVRGAFQDSLRLNLGLVIDDPDGCIDRLAGQVRFPGGKTPATEDVGLQIREIFCKLFFECEKIRLEEIQQGFSGAAVFQVTPTYQGKGQGQGVVVKVGNRDEISTEISNYEHYVKGIVGGHRIPEALRSASTRHTSGILYSFVGLGSQTENFASFYQSAWLDELLPTLDNLFLETLFPLKDKTGRLKEDCDLRAFYLRHLHLDNEKIQKIVTGLTSGGAVFSERADGAWQFGAERLPNPLRYASGANFRADVFFTTIHGDLNGQNILLDQHRATWLIDFLTTTDDGHILQDYAALETNIRFRLALDADTGIDLPLQWACACFNANLPNAPAPTEIFDHPGLLKAHRVMLHIRALAAQTSGYTERAYLVALFFNTLRAATYREATDATRNHALYCAAKIANRLIHT